MKALNPGYCGGFWSPIAASGPESALSGVLAGFVFTAITVILTTGSVRQGEGEEKSFGRSYALQLLISAFITLALDSYLGSVTAGELACGRAYAESALLGGILADGAVLMIAGLGWLIVSYSGQTEGLGSVLSYVNGGVWVIVIFMLATTGSSIGAALLPGRSHVITDIVPWILGCGLAAAITMTAYKYRELDEDGVAIKSHDDRIQKWVRYAALSGLAAAIFAGLFIGTIGSFGDSEWIRPPSEAVYLVVVLSILVPAFALWATIRPAMAVRAIALANVPQASDATSESGTGS